MRYLVIFLFVGLLVWVIFALMGTKKTIENRETANIRLDDTLSKVNQAESNRLDYLNSF